MKQAEITAAPGLRTLLGSDQSGPCLVEDPAHRALYIFNHFEYDRDTLKQEYDRDAEAGRERAVLLGRGPFRRQAPAALGSPLAGSREVC